MKILQRKSLALLLAGALTTQLAACGTVFYPERKGQVSGRIDPVVAIANGVGLLFFVVPGVIAFAVDFATGAIYLPGGGRTELQPNATPDSLNDSLYASTGQRIDWQQDRVLVETLGSTDEARQRLIASR
ncbi:hypothetical protein GCM10022421_29260 [Oceanisphaera sediminis]|uniref:Uncharacterized protein n=1 Tax=Oceanisphaera sediminis TaxID=981381 RepID=A0ABP7EJF9_9GAMM